MKPSQRIHDLIIRLEKEHTEKYPETSSQYFGDIDAIIQYLDEQWQENQTKPLKEGVCAHESDGMSYTSNPPQSKCIKCGQFYR